MLIHTIQGEQNLLALHTQNPTRYPYLLESVTRSSLSRYSILFAHPLDTITSYHDDKVDFLQTFDQQFALQALENENTETSLPFRGGWFVYLGYELAQQVESTLDLPEETANLPIAQAVRIPAAVIIDHAENQSHIVVEAEYPKLFKQIKADVDALISVDLSSNKKSDKLPLKILKEDNEKAYLDGCKKIKDYICAGDVFQVNFSRMWNAKTADELTSAQLYEVLREKNPAPFAALCQFDDWSVISSSPERLVSVNNRCIETRPIAGTRPRSKSDKEDKALLDELIGHPKERAEHIMLIDLERNDMGRICQPGTVDVNELMTLESYEHVHHIVSNIRGILREDVTPGEVIRAVFPGGTITGCPKVRCMEIIAELEKTGRGAYTGSVGYINHNGDMDFNILIRTMTQVDNNIRFRTGAGIVFDSIPEHELEETRHKAKGLLRVFKDDSG